MDIEYVVDWRKGDPPPPWLRRFWERELDVRQQRELLQLEKKFAKQKQDILVAAKEKLDNLEINMMDQAQKIMG